MELYNSRKPQTNKIIAKEHYRIKFFSIQDILNFQNLQTFILIKKKILLKSKTQYELIIITSFYIYLSST